MVLFTKNPYWCWRSTYYKFYKSAVFFPKTNFLFYRCFLIGNVNSVLNNLSSGYTYDRILFSKLSSILKPVTVSQAELITVKFTRSQIERQSH
jgi:hypothetical protein